jgi:hypothetical protein
MSNAISAMGTTFDWNTQEVSEVQNLTGPSQSRSTIDVTHYGSSDDCKEFIVSFKDGGDCTVVCNWDSSDTNGQIAMITDYEAGTEREAVITLPDATTITFNGVITGVQGPIGGIDEPIRITYTIKVSGAVAIA